MTHLRRALAGALAATFVVAACGSNDSSSDSTTSIAEATTTSAAATVTTPAPAATTTAATDAGVSAAGISPERCAANKAAGTITYLSGFDLSASASIVEVVVAQERGYYEKMCLDVDVQASFSTANYPLIAAGRAQFASAGSFSELVAFSQELDTSFVAVQQDGHAGIDALLVTDPAVKAPADLKGATIGVKGKITPSVKALLFQAGLVEDKDYQTILLQGFDPKAHVQQPVAGFPVYKSNEPGQLERAGIPFTLFDPATEGIPGSFGIIYTSADFAKEHPSATQDFVRASLKGLEDAIADPAAAVALCLAKIKEGGNTNFLSDEGESFRWQTESKLVVSSTPAGSPVGVIVPAMLQTEVEALTKAGVFTTVPTIDGLFDAAVAAGVYDANGKIIWPSS